MNCISVYDLRRAIDGADDLLPVSLTRKGEHADPVAVFARYCRCASRREGLVIEIEDSALDKALDEVESLSTELNAAEETIADLKAELAKSKPEPAKP